MRYDEPRLVSAHHALVNARERDICVKGGV